VDPSTPLVGGPSEIVLGDASSIGGRSRQRSSPGETDGEEVSSVRPIVTVAILGLDRKVGEMSSDGRGESVERRE
jgi:hypothetical protein